MHILVTGGARSGKSSFAENLYNNQDDVVYLASYISDPNDVEMQLRIKKHQEQRNSLWKTIELEHYIDVQTDKVMFDCLSVFTSNVMFHYTKDMEYIDGKTIDIIINHITQEVDKLLKNTKQAVIVTNEVGNGLVPAYHLERVYRDLLGRVNRYVADQVDNVYLVVCGQALKIKETKNNEN